jgi:hypothetical protein
MDTMTTKQNLIRLAAALRFHFNGSEEAVCDRMEKIIKSRFHFVSFQRHRQLAQLAKMRVLLKQKNIIDIHS